MYKDITSTDYQELHSRLKSSAKKRNIPFDLTVWQLEEMGLPLTCPVFPEIHLKFNKKTVRDDSYSFDRIDSSKGYTIDNLVIVSQRANRLKSNMTLEELKSIVAFYEQILMERKEAEASLP